MRSVALILAALLLASSMQAAPEDAKDVATLKVVQVEKGKGEMTVKVAIEWAKGAAQPKTDEITVVFLFQNKTGLALQLDAALLANLGPDNLSGILESENLWVLRTVTDLKKKKAGEVLQVIASDEKATADFRKNGEYTLKLRTSHALNRELPTDTIHVGLFQETDPKEWQQSSTSYRRLSNVVELPSK